MTVFIRSLDAAADEKASALLAAIEALSDSRDAAGTVFDVPPDEFCAISGTPFSYWLSRSLRSVFQRVRRFECNERFARKGLSTDDDFRFVRCHWEVAPNADAWPPLLKGGRRSPYYANVPAVVKWAAQGSELKAFTIGRYGNAGKRVFNEEHYLRAGLTWPLRGIAFSASAVGRGAVFSGGGKMAFGPPEELAAMLAIFNSAPFDYFIRLFAGKVGGVQYESGLIGRVPYPGAAQLSHTELSRLAREAWSLRRALDTTNETSHAFVLPPSLTEKTRGFDPVAIEWQVEAIQRQINDEAYRLYGISDEDRVAIETPANTATSEGRKVGAEAADDADEGDDDDVVGGGSDALGSWLVSVAFGRFDPRLATGERPLPPEPEPFDPLPSRSPGMYPEGEEPADRPDILVDDEGHPNDLSARAIAVAERVEVDAPENLRAWLAKEFFPLHIKMYSKSRRKAPIYWQLATPSASYSVWLYLHAFSKDTLFRVQNDYVAPKLAHEERRLESLASELRDGATAAQRKQLAAQEGLVEELRAFLDEVKRAAPLWKPNLDDGVIINFAPLWRLVPQNKAWQKELKSTWDALHEGKYDWAHLAMHLWPERVVPECAKDRSLAIVHGLEDVFWVEDDKGKWAPRKTPTMNVDELVKERISPAVKSALKSLLEAPVASGSAKKTRKRKANA